MSQEVRINGERISGLISPQGIPPSISRSNNQLIYKWFTNGVCKWVLTYNPKGYPHLEVEILTNLLTIDPNFQQDIQVDILLHQSFLHMTQL